MIIHTHKSLEKLVRRLQVKYRKGLLPSNESYFSHIPKVTNQSLTKDTLHPMNSNDNDGVIAIEDLMDQSIDALKDLPGFEVPPRGHYKLKVSLEQKVVSEKPGIEASCTVLETLELTNEADKKVEVGTKFSQLFFMDNEWGQGGFKSFVSPIASVLNFTTVRSAVEGIKDVTIAATLGHRYHKEDKNKPMAERRVYADLKNVEVL